MKCTLKKTVLASFLEALTPIVTDCRAVIDDQGISVKAVCTGNVSLVVATLPREAFVTMDETGTAELVGLEVSKILTAVNMVDDADDAVTLEKIVDDPRLHITGPGVKYTWRTIDPHVLKKQPNPPSILLPTTVTMDATAFKKAVDKIGKVGDKIRFVTDGDELFTLEGDGDDNKVALTLDADVMGPAASSLYSLDYVASMAKVIGKADNTVTIKLGIDHPVILEFERDGGEYLYMLAPRIEAE
jgi:DNA polymerase III sliding clamp (beta) subunit (PCNA family)